jgi:subtilisin family serine protease
VQPKLRMVANGDSTVNAIRAEHAAAIRVSDSRAQRTPTLRTQRSVPVLGKNLRVPKTKKLAAPPAAEVSLFVQLRSALEDEPQDLKGKPVRKLGALRTVEMKVREVETLRKHPSVSSIELGQPVKAPDPVVTEHFPASPEQNLRRFGNARKHHYGRDRVLIGIVDVGGFDFAHPDFLDADGNTRFVKIWDQGGTNRPRPEKFAYGSELDQSLLNEAIKAASKLSAPAYKLEPQSQLTPGSHGTHVASIAAGNRGVCRQASIAAVLLALPKDAYERRRSFYDSSRIAHAVDYLVELGEQLELPVSINISLGTNGHAHDDSSPVSRWIDLALTVPGRSVAIAAGNAGQERSEEEGDVGYVMGRVHTSGRVAARELTSDLEWNVVGNGVADVSENELEIWYGAQDRFAVQVKPPGEGWTDPLTPGEFIENRELADGTFLSVYNEIYNPANGANYIAVYLSPRLSEPVVGVQAGVWLVRLVGEEVRDGRYHAWIERDDPRRVGRVGEREAWVFPSFFSEASFVDNSTVSSLACGQRIVSVANLDEAGRRIAITSSQGPTRDGRQKPDVAAPGTKIVAAKGFAGPDPWVEMSGTSMASPFVAGVVGLMLSVNPELTGAQISGILKRTARPLPGVDFSWRDDAGAGAIDPEACLVEADQMRTRVDRT